jgi:choline kinase
MTQGGDVLLMDGDVLYDRRIMKALVQGSEVGNRVLIDRDFEAGEEPVKVCVRAGLPVEFRKRLPADLEYDSIGESVGFFRFNAAGATRLAQIIRQYADNGHGSLPHEEAIRDFLLEGSQKIDICDVTGSPWIEIDFPDDVNRAALEILPLLAPV